MNPRPRRDAEALQHFAATVIEEAAVGSSKLDRELAAAMGWLRVTPQGKLSYWLSASCEKHRLLPSFSTSLSDAWMEVEEAGWAPGVRALKGSLAPRKARPNQHFEAVLHHPRRALRNWAIGVGATPALALMAALMRALAYDERVREEELKPEGVDA